MTIIPKDFYENGKWQKDFLNHLVKKTLQFQRDLLKAQTPMQQSLADYFQILGEKAPTLELPIFLVAPYFYFETPGNTWYSISLKLAKLADSQKERMPLFVMICASKELLLDKKSLTQVAKDYSGFDGYILWFSKLNDEKDPEQYLSGLAEFIDLLNANKKPIMLLYGSEFGLLLNKVAENYRGYSRGICYGESKDVDAETPLAGGAPKRYYYDLTGTKISESVARSFFSDNPKQLCSCDVCMQFSPSGGVRNARDVARFFDNFGLVQMRRHFMVGHGRQIKKVVGSSRSYVLKDLSARKQKGDSISADIYGIPLTQLIRWKSVLEK